MAPDRVIKPFAGRALRVGLPVCLVLGLTVLEQWVFARERPQVYHTGGPLSAAVPVRPFSRPDGAFVTWLEGGARRSQTLFLPRGWRLPPQHSTKGSPPEAFLWRAGRKRLLVLVAGRKSGVYGYRCPIVFRRQKGRWRLASRGTQELQFSNRGSFYTQGRLLYVWDYAAAPDASHWAPQRYWLREFLWRGEKLGLRRTRLTQRNYDGLDVVDDPPHRVEPAQDPLREFGLRWRSWGVRAE